MRILLAGLVVLGAALAVAGRRPSGARAASPPAVASTETPAAIVPSTEVLSKPEAAAPSPSLVAAAILAPARHSPYREVSATEEICREVGATPAQRSRIEALLQERDAMLHSIWTEVVVDGRDADAAVADLYRVEADYRERIREQLDPEQRVRLDAAVRENRFKGPLLVYRQGSE